MDIVFLDFYSRSLNFQFITHIIINFILINELEFCVIFQYYFQNLKLKILKDILFIFFILKIRVYYKMESN